MRIIQINTVYGIRSTGRITKETHHFLLEQGVESFVAYSEGEKPINGYKIGKKLEKKIHGLMSRITGLQGYFSKKSTKKFIKYLENIKPDVVHIGNLHSNFINMPILFEYLAQKNIATIITLHDCWFYTGGHTHYTNDNYYDWKTGFKKENKNKNIMGNKSWFFDKSQKIFSDQIDWFSGQNKTTFVGVSQWITDEVKKSKVAEKSNVKLIYNWVDTTIFKPKLIQNIIDKYNPERDFIILGVASQWTQKKGLYKFYELAKQLDEGEKIILVGSIDDKSDIPNNILNIEETNEVEKLSQIYSLANVFVNFSEEETFGNVSAEAMACGIPVITNSGTANPELIGKKCGYVLSEMSTKEIKKTYKKIKERGKDYYSQSCIKFVKNNFNKTDNLEKYLKLYKNIIKE